MLNFGGDARGIGRDVEVADTEARKMRVPGRGVGEGADRMGGEARHERSGEAMLGHIDQGRVVDDIIGMAGAQAVQKVQAAFRLRRLERGEEVIADLGADAVAALVARAGVIDADPVRRRQPRAQHVARLVEKIILAGDEKPDELTLGDIDPEAAKLFQQARHRHLPQVILNQHVAAELRAEMTIDASGKRRDDALPRRRQPALAAIAHDMGAHDQVLDHEVLGALEP
jgi:hypothetical protein